MYTSIYIYRVPQDHIEAFLRVQREAAVIYRQYGALDDETFGPCNLEAKYGCSPFPAAFEIEEGEEVFVSLSRFRDLAHHDVVMSQVDADERIGQLYEEISNLLDVGHVVRGEFERVV
jgi:uncharacterized protein YbaA (DUF1428 family)